MQFSQWRIADVIIHDHPFGMCNQRQITAAQLITAHRPVSTSNPFFLSLHSHEALHATLPISSRHLPLFWTFRCPNVTLFHLH